MHIKTPFLGFFLWMFLFCTPIFSIPQEFLLYQKPPSEGVSGQEPFFREAPERAFVSQSTSVQDILTLKIIGILLPLTGKNAHIGHSVLKGIQLAFFKHQPEGLDLKIYDTESTEEGLQKRLQEIRVAGVKVVIGPVFRESVQKVQSETFVFPPLFFTFSNDHTLVNQTTYILGLTAEQQVKTLIKHLPKNNTPVDFFVPDSPLGKTYEEVIARHVPEARIHRIEGSSPQTATLELEDEKERRVVCVLGWGLESIPLAAHIKASAPKARLTFLGDYGLTHPQIKADPVLKKARSVQFNSKMVSQFHQVYQSFYQETPHLLALYGYDILSVLLTCEKKMKSNQVSLQTVLNSTQFQGITGLLSINPQTGVIQRVL